MAAVNITKIAIGVENAMRAKNQGAGMLDTAKYASLVASIGKQAAFLKHVDGAGVPSPDPANNDLVHFVTSALMNVLDFEFDSAKPWSQLATTCMDFADNFLSVNWSGLYRGPNGQRLNWDINQAIQGPFQDVFHYCYALQNLTLSGGSILDIFDDDWDGVNDDTDARKSDMIKAGGSHFDRKRTP